MIPELGHFALILALCLAVIQGVFPIVGAARGLSSWMALARPAARAQFLFLVLAFAALAYSFVVNDFSVAYVARNSNSLLPVHFRLSAVWGGHEGSLLLWSLVLGLWTFAVTVFSRGLPAAFVARVLGVMGLVSVGFLLFMLLTSNPFMRLAPAPVDGADLNPLLQDFGLIVHPPMLYMGYVGFSVAFGFAIAALLGGHLDATWARWSRPWTTVAWMFLTVGIALGSWWAYYELGWGGWWFWDPVENASFMPWLVGTALIHSLAATEKRGAFKSWTVLLAICAFALSLLGTFLVRSGVLTSVHAFATDPARGIFILSFLGIVIGGSFILYAWRAPQVLGGSAFGVVSRESFLLTNNVLLLVAMATILLGTLYPLVIDALGLGKLSVGPPYFNTVFVPIMALLATVLGFGPFTRWRRDELARLWQQLRYAALGAVVIGVSVFAALGGTNGIKVGLGVALAMWIVLGTLQNLRSRLIQRRSIWASLSSQPRGFYGMSLAHMGLATVIVGVMVSSLYSTEMDRSLVPGETIEVGGYTFLFDGVHEITGPNFQASEGELHVFKDGKPVTVLRPQKRIYQVRSMPMTEAAIDPGLTRDLYVSLGDPLDDGGWTLRLYHKPFVRWIWLGAIFMALGGLLAVTDPRYRLATGRRERALLDALTGKAMAAGKP
ncbi:MAG: heme lyase CcmF/NrfE family subunit [Acidiferrobacterales bacterium]